MIRISATGASRDDNYNKLEYIRFNDPRVEKIYCYFLTKHRKMADGSLREPDNWKKGFDAGVVLDSKGRHFLDQWEYEKYGFAKRPDEEVNEVESLCAEMFGVKARLYELLQDDSKYQEAIDYFMR